MMMMMMMMCSARAFDRCLSRARFSFSLTDALRTFFNTTQQTYDKSHALSTEDASTMKTSIFNHFTIPEEKGGMKTHPIVRVTISDPHGVKKEYPHATGHVEETVEGVGFGTYSACFTNKGGGAGDVGHVVVQVHFFQPHHDISDAELQKELKALKGEHFPGQRKGLRANQLHDSVALAESLLDDVERIRGEIRYLTWRTKRHKQTVDSNALRTTWLTFIEIVVLCMCAWMQIHAVKEYFATSSGDLVEGGRSQGFEYQGKYESVRNVGPAGGFGPGSGNFGMPPVPQMFQSQQQQRPAAPQMYQQHPPPTQMYDAHKTQYGKNDEFQREIPSQGILPNQYGGGSAPQARTGRQYQDR